MANLWLDNPDNEDKKQYDGVKIKAVNVGTDEEPIWMIPMVQKDEEGNNTGPVKIVTDDIVSGDLTANAYTFSAAVDAVAVKNDGTSDMTVTISTLGFTIKPGESRILELAAFTVVTFSAGAVFRMNGLRRG